MSEVTEILSNIEAGDPKAAEQLLPLVYDELRKLAAATMAQERPGQTLQATSLVHDAYIRLVDQSQVEGKGRLHFLGLAAREMRRVLVEYARGRNRAKRGGGWRRVQLEPVVFPTGEHGVEILDIDQALQKLTSLNEHQGRIVELRFFAGLTVDEVAEALGTSRRTVEREWRAARAWLYCHLKES